MNVTANRRTAGNLADIAVMLSAVMPALALLLCSAGLLALGRRQTANALPAFARQTGQPCATCYIRFPELTPFGRRFKIGGYTLQGGDWKGPPIAAMYMAGFTHTNSPFDPGTQPAGLHTNDNLVSQQVSGFVAGRLWGDLGSFIQITGDPVAGTVGLDASDVRYADTFKLFGKDTIWASTPTIRRRWKIPGTRPLPGAGRRSPRPSLQLSPPR